MGKIPIQLRETIARNIRERRKIKFPGRGGSKQCAEAFGVSPQQWSPWETAKRTPDEEHLGKIAEFFGVTVEDLRRDNRPSSMSAPKSEPNASSREPQPGVFGQIPGVDTAPDPGWQPDAPGSPASFFWLARYFISFLQTRGLRIDKQCLDYLADAIRRPPY